VSGKARLCSYRCSAILSALNEKISRHGFAMHHQAKRPPGSRSSSREQAAEFALGTEANGTARFFVVSMGIAPQGCCGGQHLAVWHWNGQDLRTLLWKTYPICRCSEPNPYKAENVSFDDGIIAVTMKGQLNFMWTACGDENPRAVGASELHLIE
jgi:hypothetical protein